MLKNKVKIFGFLLIFLLEFTSAKVWAQKENNSAIIVVCTVNAECAQVIALVDNPLASWKRVALPNGALIAKVFKAEISDARSLFILIPRFEGHDQEQQKQSIFKTIELLRSQESLANIETIIGFGSAGARSGNHALRLGDVVVGIEQDYFITSESEPSLRGVNSKIPFKAGNLNKLVTNISVAKDLPFNPAPKIQVRLACHTVNSFVHSDKRNHFEEGSCFQRNDYMTALVAKEMGVNFISVRAITDIEKVPELVVSAFKADEYFKEIVFGKKMLEKDNSRVERRLYWQYSPIYLANAAKSLKKIIIEFRLK